MSRRAAERDTATTRFHWMRRAAGLAVALPFLAVGCGGPPAGAPAGRSGTPSRIVSLSPALTEILFALGLGDRVVGVTTYCDWPPEARRLPKIGGFVDPSVEAVVALSPDLVLVSPAAGNRDSALAIRRLGIRVEVVRCETLREAFDAIETIGRLCGIAERGRDVAGAIRARVESAAARVRAAPPVPALLCVQMDPLIAAGAGTLPSELLELAGGRNVVSAGRYPRIGIEAVIASAPEAILVARMDAIEAGDPARILDQWKRWPSIPAVKNGRVHVIDATTALRAGPRVADAVDVLAGLLHPELAGDAASGRRP